MDIRPTFEDPIKKGIDRSRPPNITTKVWPIVANPKNAENTSMDLMFWTDRNPSIETDPIIKSPIKTETPIITLLLIFRNLYATKASIKKPKNITAETTVRPEKKPGTRKQSIMNNASNNKKPTTTIQFLEIISKNKLLLCSSEPSIDFSKSCLLEDRP